MKIEGVIKQANEREIVIRTKQDISLKELKQLKLKNNFYTVTEIVEPNSITRLQQRHFYALLGDYEEYTGVPLESAESYFKVQFMVNEGMDELPSVGLNRMTKRQAVKLLTFMIEYFIENGIPFRKQQFYLTLDTSRMLFALTMKRICWVCGKPNSDIHHATNLVGMGNKRHKHSHDKSTFMCLCTQHHNEIHHLGLTDFEIKYHVKPIKINKEHIKELNI